MKMSTIFIVAVFISGCAAGPGELKKEDMVWYTETINANYQEVYRRINIGFQHCASSSRVEGQLYPDLGIGSYEVIAQSYPFATPPRAMGHIDIRKSTETDKTEIEIGVKKLIDKPLLGGEKGKVGRLWMKYAKGVYECY